MTLTTFNLKNIVFTDDEPINSDTNQVIGRISSQAQNIYKVLTEQGELYAKVSGKFMYDASKLADYPAVGDFIALGVPDSTENGVIHQILPRKSSLSRQRAANATDEQLIATNIDMIFICMSLNEDYNL